MPAHRKPQHLKILEPDVGKRPERHSPQARPFVDPPAPPEWLDPTAATLWADLAPRLVELGTLNPVDLSAFEVLCVTYSTWRQAVAVVAAEGVTRPGRNRADGSVKHPATQIAKDSASTFKAYCTLFGVTPWSRERLAAPWTGEDPHDELERLLRGEG